MLQSSQTPRTLFFCQEEGTQAPVASYNSQTHRVAQVGKDLRDHCSNLLAMGRDTSLLDLVAQGLIQSCQNVPQVWDTAGDEPNTQEMSWVPT